MGLYSCYGSYFRGWLSLCRWVPLFNVFFVCSPILSCVLDLLLFLAMHFKGSSSCRCASHSFSQFFYCFSRIIRSLGHFFFGFLRMISIKIVEILWYKQSWVMYWKFRHYNAFALQVIDFIGQHSTYKSCQALNYGQWMCVLVILVLLGCIGYMHNTVFKTKVLMFTKIS